MKAGYFSSVYRIVSAIPPGKVATYGQIAALLGDPRGARLVGWALHGNPYPGMVPCHRVINRRGELSGEFAFGGSGKQRMLLEKEGIRFLRNGTVDLPKYLWQPSINAMREGFRSLGPFLPSALLSTPLGSHGKCSRKGHDCP